MMERNWLSFCLVLCIFQPLCISLDQASFYGNSYISIPLKEAKDSTDIHFKFRTRLPSSLLLLVAGSTDYCIVRLDNSRLKVNINLGAGESELLTPRSAVLSDFKWHEVFIIRKEANLSIVVDNTHTVRKNLPGKFFELNINYGLFVGGRGNYSDFFFGHLVNFRGCLSDVMYNGLYVLDVARRRQSQAVVNSVTWSCASEFASDNDRPISFIEDEAFMVIPHSVEHILKLQVELKTFLQHSIIFYNSGLLSKLDLFAVEVWDGKLKVTLKCGNAVIENTNHMVVADGHWHKISLRVSASSIDLNVNSNMSITKLPRGHFLEFNELFYVGGIEIGKRARAMSKGLKTADGSFKGCIRHLSFGDHKKGLLDVYVSEGLLPGCLWEYPCVHKPCNGNNVCLQRGLDSFKCECRQKDCGNHTKGKVYARTNLADELELLALEPLEVLEGQNVLITTTNLHVILDYPKYDIKDNGITFNVIDGPTYGSIKNVLWNEKNSFTLSDVSRDKVFYIHDGSEYHKDHVLLEVEFSTGEHFILPSYLQGKFQFTLHVNVVPVNDPPVLNVPTTSVLRIAKGTKKLLDSHLFQVNDPDNSAKQLVYNVEETSLGHFEYVHEPGQPVSSFTHKDVENDQIAFIHRAISANDSYITLQVSDGIETSSSAKLRVQTFPQYWRLQNNTGLVLMHQTSAVITPFNLSFVSNVANTTDNAQYHVVQGPQFGIVETEKNGGYWESSIIFTSEDIRRHHVRYRHVTAVPDYDEFQFRTSLNMSLLYIFRMTFAKCELKPLKSGVLTLNSLQEMTLSNNVLEYQTQPVPSPTTSVTYLITRAPMYGFLFSAVSKYRMRHHDTFTQEDIVSYNIKYKLYRKSYSSVVDVVLFKVMVHGCRNITGNLTINHQPSNETVSRVQTVFQRLQVVEGGKTNIGTSHLSIKSDLVSDLFFNVTFPPAHGWLQIVRSAIIRNKTNYFTSSELASNQLFYVHDDSETKYDSFQFMALSREEENFQYVQVFHIDILLKNDNSPVRTVDKVFHVVVGGQKLLTKDDLTYLDADLDTLPSNIIYTCKELPNGDVYSVKNTSIKLTKFTQADLNDKAVLFKHKGPEYGKLRLWVTDGQFHVNGILEVQASAPFIRLFTNKKLIVKQGSKAVIRREHLSYTTNLYADDANVKYEITTKPGSGRIAFGDKLEDILQFTQAQINEGKIFYVNELITASADEIGIRVRCSDAINVAQLRVWMLPSGYWEPLSLKTCRTLSVEESTSALINRAVLEIFQPEVPASAITYYINEFPANGYVSILPAFKNSEDESTTIRSFSQSIMNENRIIYIQSVANQTKDRIIFNVSNGMVWLNNVMLDVQIIPEHLYLGTNILNVYEGGVVLISSVHLFVLTDYYKTRITEYILVELPKHGCIQIQKSCVKLHKFSHKELKAGLIHYAHDGSENLKDEVKLTAVAGQKRSLPVTLSILILPINDQNPVIVNNTGLVMWEGGTAVITNSMLAAVDEDRPADILRYQVLGCWWGNVSLLSDSSTSLQFFTQELINKNLVAFRHLNGSEAKFMFNVSDGLHSSKEHAFLVKTRPVVLDLLSKSLHIFPLQRKYLTSSYIAASVSDPSRAIHFQVVVPPSLGRLMMESDTQPGIFKVIGSFTQNDLNNSRVFYEHTHPFADLYANDSFQFNVQSHLAQPLLNRKLSIDISVSSGGLDAYVNIPKIKVVEGGIISIPLNLSGVISFLESHAGLRSPIMHAFASKPQHGEIFLQNNSNLTTFTQQQLESGLVLYQHDHSDSLGDNIYFSLYLIPGYIMLCNITVPIIVEPINDQPFKLLTPAPHLLVVQGENHTITKNELCTEDADTPPSELRYDVISGPKEGFIVLLPDGIFATSHFSQADIENNNLIYVHNGSLLTDTFHLRVWDGKFWPAYIVFNVQVLPISLKASSGAPLFLQQGSNVVLLSENQFVIETNANRRNTRYLIKRPPKHGVVYVKDALASEFKQNEIVLKNVMYMQTDMTTANDSFEVFVGMIRGNTSVGTEVTITIIVQPLMQIGNITVLTGETTRLTLSVLDATPLAKLTSSNPRYSVIQKPQHGEIRKIIRSSGEQKNVLDTVVTSFSHDEIQSGLIYFVVRDVEVGWNGMLDHLKFVLAASIFQPAVGELKINIRSSLLNEIYSTLAGPNDPAGHEGGIHFASPNMTRDYFLIVSMVAGVVILGVAVIIVIKCRSFEPEQLNKEEQCLQPIPLPRPPDRLMASSPPLKHSQDGFPSPLLAALPQCKVTPLNRNELDNHARYPYGVEEHGDDWSSCDASDPACPNRNNIMLRRNQYWV